MITAHPLCWPLGYPRTEQKDKMHAQFRTPFAKARDSVIKEIERHLNGRSVVISTNLPLRKDGLPYSAPFGSLTVVDDTAIAVYFTIDNVQKVICCDAFLTLDDNMQAIRKTVENLRALERYKCSQILARSFAGLNALPTAIITPEIKRPWYEVLGVPAGAGPLTIKHVYHEKAILLHPDKETGDKDKFIELKTAYDEGMKQFV